MMKFYFVFFFLIPCISFSQQSPAIRGSHPNLYLLHNVSPGETYLKIANLYNITPAEIANYNSLTLHKEKIFARTLNIPLTTKNFTRTTSMSGAVILVPVVYELNKNESFTNVLKRFNLSVKAAAELNTVSEQESYNLKKLTIGFLRAKPQAESFFGMVKTVNPVKKKVETELQEITEHTDTLIIQRNPAVRLSKSRTDVTPVPQKTELTLQDTAVVSIPADTSADQATILKSDRLKVFVDCSNTWCDRTFIRTEINIVDFLLDRVASDVHLLITSQRNGNGGSQLQMIFYGQNKFKSIKDTLRLNIDPNATDNERREAMVKYIKLGLTTFIAKTDYADDVNIVMKKDLKSAEATSNANTKDKWNYWVFRAGANGNISLQEVYKSTRFNGNFSANRTTDKLKTGFSTNAGETIEKYFDDSSGQKIETIKNSNYQIEHFLVKSLGERWSAGYQVSVSNSTFSNNKSRINFGAGIEYAIFPYKEVNNKFFTINYSINARRNKYYDSTIYFKIEEQLFEQEASLNLSLKQKWGTISSKAEYSSYLHNTKLNNISGELNLDVRISGGLSVYGYMSAARVHDQINLLKGSATALQVLTRQRELASKFRFYSGFGISYRFGSKLNNFINPRFDDGD